MATEKEFQQFLEKRKLMLEFGIRQGFVKPYDQNLITNLRNVFYGGVPLSVLMLCNDFCKGNCHNSACLISCGFGDDDFQIVKASINSFCLNPKNKQKEKSTHSFAERKTSDGKTWVYDTSLGLVIEKSFYYQIENPVVVSTKTKQETLQFVQKIFENDQNFEAKEWLEPFMVHFAEKMAKNTKTAYKAQLSEEMKIFKNKSEKKQTKEKTL